MCWGGIRERSSLAMVSFELSLGRSRDRQGEAKRGQRSNESAVEDGFRRGREG